MKKITLRIDRLGAYNTDTYNIKVLVGNSDVRGLYDLNNDSIRPNYPDSWFELTTQIKIQSKSEPNKIIWTNGSKITAVTFETL